MHHSLVEGSQQTDSIHIPSKIHIRYPSQLMLGSPRIVLIQSQFPKVKPIVIKQHLQGSQVKQIKNTSYTNRNVVKTLGMDSIQLPKEEMMLKEKNKKLLLRKNMTRKLQKITDYLSSYRKP